jgi:hypothetical protein
MSKMRGVLAVSPKPVSSRLGAVRSDEVPTEERPPFTLHDILRRIGISNFDLVSDIE